MCSNFFLLSLFKVSSVFIKKQSSIDPISYKVKVSFIKLVCIYCIMFTTDCSNCVYENFIGMELHVQGLFGLRVHSCNCPPFLPHLGSYTRALLVSKDRLENFVAEVLLLQGQ